MKRILLVGLACLLIGGGTMALAGDWGSPYLWAFTLFVLALGLWVAFQVLDPDLARERFRPPTHGEDPKALAWIRMSALAVFVLAPIDSGRFHWSSVPAWVRIVGLCGFAAGCLIVFRAMSTNRFFSPVVRIQSERGHQVVDTGPYGSIRHPGYLGMAIFAPMAALALGSWWALVPALCYDALILHRAAIEDEFLRRNLPGYSEYAARVRARIVPGVW